MELGDALISGLLRCDSPCILWSERRRTKDTRKNISKLTRRQMMEVGPQNWWSSRHAGNGSRQSKPRMQIASAADQRLINTAQLLNGLIAPEYEKGQLVLMLFESSNQPFWPHLKRCARAHEWLESRSLQDLRLPHLSPDLIVRWHCGRVGRFQM